MQTIPHEFEEQVGAMVREAMSLTQSLALQMVKEAFQVAGASLGAPGLAPKSSVRAPSGPKAPRKQRHPSRSTEEIAQMSDQLFDTIMESPGELMAFYGAALGVTARELSVPARRLSETGRVRKVGSKVHMRYFPMVVPTGQT